MRASLKNLTLLLHLNVTLLGEKIVHVLYLDHKAKGKVSVNKKSAPPFLAHSILCFGVFNIQLHIS